MTTGLARPNEIPDRLPGQALVSALAGLFVGAVSLALGLPFPVAGAMGMGLFLLIVPTGLAAVGYAAVVLVDRALVNEPIYDLGGFGVWIRDFALLAMALGALWRILSGSVQPHLDPRGRNLLLGVMAVFAASPLLTLVALGPTYAMGSLSASWRCALMPFEALIIALGVRTHRERKWCLWGLAVICVFMASSVLFDVQPPAGVIMKREAALDRRGGVLADPEGMAALALLAVCLIQGADFSRFRNAAVGFRGVIVSLSLSLCMVLAILLTQTRVVLIALIGCAALLILSGRSKAKLPAAMFVVGVTILLATAGDAALDRLRSSVGDEYGIREGNTEFRILGWQLAWEAAVESRFLGLGWCGLSQYIQQPSILSLYANHTQGVYIVSGPAAEMLASFGAFAPLLYFLLIRALLALTKPRGDIDDSLRARGRACVLVFFVALQQHVLIMPTSYEATMVWAVIGVLTSCSPERLAVNAPAAVRMAGPASRPVGVA